MTRMPHAIRLLAVADARDTVSAARISVSVRLAAVLDDGRTVTLLEGRGWTAELRGPGAADVADVWETTSARDIEQTARVVVGPDEPFGGLTQADMERDHWEALAANLRGQGVDTQGAELGRLAVEVVMTERLRALIGGRQ
jgi:hypothetical protein